MANTRRISKTFTLDAQTLVEIKLEAVGSSLPENRVLDSIVRDWAAMKSTLKAKNQLKSSDFEDGGDNNIDSSENRGNNCLHSQLKALDLSNLQNTLEAISIQLDWIQRHLAREILTRHTS